MNLIGDSMVRSKELQNELVDSFNHDHKCCVCDTTNDLTIDHIYPKSLGGLDNILNMRITCSKHNGNKGNYIDYSLEYMSVAYINTAFLKRIVKSNNHLSTHYTETIIKKAIGRTAYNENYCISMKDYDYFVEFMGLYGVKIKHKPITGLIPKTNAKLLGELRLNYVISKQAILNYFIMEY